MNIGKHDHLDDIMERASVALTQMDYLDCETLCLEALAIARQQRDWMYYARILLPLQEARRQRRMIAAEGLIRLGTATLGGKPEHWLDEVDAGCVVVTRPHTQQEAGQLHDFARENQRHVEVLLVDNNPDDERWTLRAFAGPDVTCDVKAPPRAWVDRWLPTAPGGGEPTDANDQTAPPTEGGAAPADWFIDATEALGDAALAQIQAPLGDERRVDELERCLKVVADHEIIHQRLFDAAQAASRACGHE